jgi:hypothetical protein
MICFFYQHANRPIGFRNLRAVLRGAAQILNTQNIWRLPRGLLKKRLACASCESVPYAVDGLGNRGRNHFTGRSVAVFHSDTVCPADGIVASRQATGWFGQARAAC